MKTQLKYALQDIWKYKLKNLTLLIQFFTAILLISFIFSITLKFNSYQDKLNEVMQDQEEEIYLSLDNTSNEKFDEIINSRDSIERQSKLYRFMKENPSFKAYTADMQYSMWLPESNIDSSFAEKYNPENYFLLKIDNEFQDVFKLKCVEGRLFSTGDFKDTGNEIPLLLGYDFQKYYKLDDVIYDYRDQSYRVIGFLEKSSFYLSPRTGNTTYGLDKAFITPLQPDRFEETEYESAIYSTFIITDDPEDLKAIQEKSNELGLYTFEFTSFTEYLNMASEGYRYGIFILGLITVTILFFAVTNFILNLMQFITNYTKEFENHFLPRGGMVPIILLILVQVFIIISLSDIIMVIIYSRLEIFAAPIFYRPTPVILLTIVASLLIGLVIIIYPVIMLYGIQKSKRLA